MVVTYRVSWLSYFLIRLLAHVHLYSLPNHLAGRQLVPELIQREATAEKLGPAVDRFLTHSAQAKSVIHALARIRRTLRRHADARAAQAVLRFLGRRSRRGSASAAVSGAVPPVSSPKASAPGAVRARRNASRP
jgi:lipid-A-disaccharide synthase